MSVCNCTLAGSLACKSCSNYLQYFQTDLTKPFEWYVYWEDVLKPFDFERYELVEKKDWKIKDLEKRIEHTKSLFRSNGEEITRLQNLENEYAKELTSLEKELKELNKENNK